MGKKRVILIGGTAYSGSTFLDLMLSNDPKGFSCGEVHALFRPYREHHRDLICGCGDSECDMWDDILEKGDRHLYKNLFGRFPELDFVVDSSKNLGWMCEQEKNARADGFDVVHLLIWKSPSAFAFSLHRRGKLGPGTWRRYKHAWLRYHRRYFQLTGRWYAVGCSELQHCAAGYLGKICHRIGIRYFGGKENYWEGKHHTLFGSSTAKRHLYDRSSDAYKRMVERQGTRRGSLTDQDDGHRAIRRPDNPDTSDVSGKLRNDMEHGRRVEKMLYVLEKTDVSRNKQDSETMWARYDTFVNRAIGNMAILRNSWRSR